MVQPLPLSAGIAEPMPVDLSPVVTACPADQRNSWDTLHQLLLDAQERDAAEIHIEPESDCLRLRFRGAFEFEEIRLEDGAQCLHSMNRLRHQLGINNRVNPVARAWFLYTVSRHAVLYQLDVLDNRKGSTFRILRMDDCRQLPARLEEIGLNRAQMNRLEYALNKRSGLVVVAGMLAQGRHRTSRAITQRLVAPDRKIIMADVPMHPDIPRTTQLTMDFPPTEAQIDTWNALCQLGADTIVSTQPMQDVVARRMVDLAAGEALVIQTISAGSASDCLARLLGLGVRSEALAHCLSTIMLQYRVRCLCTRCRVPSTPDDRGDAWLARISPIQAGNINVWLRHRMRASFSEARGCQYCNGSGHCRWLDIFDILEIGSDLRKALFEGDYTYAFSLLEKQQTSGESLLRLAQEGIISLAEAVRLTDEMDAVRSSLAD